ncbi:MAG: hypothetical protein KGJ89_00640 [Patescibacteria group bacterium]|nr:hypothetical protein [Patescibacteria group bacterium]MDE2015021.1 hypothetical protein [Patescibacteria group bacterium]MDE2226449.1 hypothetical protein [Patescibacteria group bacterium]
MRRHRKIARKRHHHRPTMEINTKHSLIPVTAIIIVVVAATALVVFRKPAQKKAVQNTSSPSPSVAENVKPIAAYASQGKLTPGFPSELILGSANATTSQSYQINYPYDGSTQDTTDFISAESMLDLFSQYKKYFSQNGWTITREITKYTNSRGLGAEKGGTSMSMAIVDNGKVREVTISYTPGK